MVETGLENQSKWAAIDEKNRKNLWDSHKKRFRIDTFSEPFASYYTKSAYDFQVKFATRFGQFPMKYILDLLNEFTIIAGTLCFRIFKSVGINA